MKNLNWLIKIGKIEQKCESDKDVIQKFEWIDLEIYYNGITIGKDKDYVQ